MKTRWGSGKETLAIDPDDFDLSDYTDGQENNQKAKNILKPIPKYKAKKCGK